MIVNEQAASEAPADAEAAAEGNVSSRLSAAALKKELELREKNMQAGDGGGVTDQWRVYQHVVQQLQTGPPLRLMVQASAGTGISADLLFNCASRFVFAPTVCVLLRPRPPR